MKVQPMTGLTTLKPSGGAIELDPGISQADAERRAISIFQTARIMARASGDAVPTTVVLQGNDGSEISTYPFETIAEKLAQASLEADNPQAAWDALTEEDRRERLQKAKRILDENDANRT